MNSNMSSSICIFCVIKTNVVIDFKFTLCVTAQFNTGCLFAWLFYISFLWVAIWTSLSLDEPILFVLLFFLLKSLASCADNVRDVQAILPNYACLPYSQSVKWKWIFSGSPHESIIEHVELNVKMGARSVGWTGNPIN